MNSYRDSCPDDWTIKQVNQVVEFLDGKRIPLKQEDRDLMKGSIPYYGASGIIDYVNDYIFDDELILLGEDGENVVSRNLPLAFKINGKSWVNNHAHVLKPNKDNDIDFLTNLFEFQDYIAYISGSAQPKITQGILAKIEFCLPDLDKQQKIAKILSTIDQLIEKIQALINKHTAIKQGMMVDLFTRGIDLTTGQLRPPVEQAPYLYKETELGWIPKGWSTDCLSSTCSSIGDGVHYSVNRVSEGIPFLFVSCVRDGSIKWINAARISNDTYEEISKNSKPYEGMILFTVVGSYGQVAYVTDDRPFGFERNIAYLKGNTEFVSSKYLFYCLMSDFVSRQVESLVVGNAQKLLSLGNLGLPITHK